MKQYKILGICGSLRKKSINLFALQAAGSLMPATLHLQGITDLSNLPIYNQDTEVEGFPAAAMELRELVIGCDGLLIASPEHNWTMSASLKNGIDWLSRFKTPEVPFYNKPCAIMSATTGQLGGARVQYDVRRSITGLGGAFLVKPEIFIGDAPAKFDANGNLTDELTTRLLKDQMLAFSSWISQLRHD